MCDFILGMITSKAVTVVLVEDDIFQLEQVKLTLEAAQGLHLVAAYSDPVKACASVGKIRPDVLLTDIEMPGMSGLRLIAICREQCPEMEIVALTVLEESPTVLSALKSGANGYLLKTCSNEELVQGIFEVARGGSPITPKIARLIIRDFQGEAAEAARQLSPREMEVLRKVETGRTYKEIGDSLNLTIHAIHWHIKKVFEKLHARNKQEALFNAKKKGLL